MNKPLPVEHCVFSASGIIRYIRDILAPAMQKQFWVRDVISSGREGEGDS